MHKLDKKNEKGTKTTYMNQKKLRRVTAEEVEQGVGGINRRVATEKKLDDEEVEGMGRNCSDDIAFHQQKNHNPLSPDNARPYQMQLDVLDIKNSRGISMTLLATHKRGPQDIICQYIGKMAQARVESITDVFRLFLTNKRYQKIFKHLNQKELMHL